MRQVVLRGAPTQGELARLPVTRLRAMIEDYGITVPADLSKSQLVKLAWDLERGLAPQHARALAVQAVLDQRKVVADVLAEAAEMAEKGASERALQWLGRSIRRGRPGVNPDAPEFAALLKQMGPLLDALDAADVAAVRAAIPRVAKSAKLRLVGGEAGQVLAYKREHMQLIGQSRGEIVHVIRPGWATQYDGELRVLLRADVQPATPEQVAAARAAAPARRAAAKKAPPAPERMTAPALRRELELATRLPGSRLTDADIAAVPKPVLAHWVRRWRELPEVERLAEIGRWSQAIVDRQRVVAEALAEASELLANGASAASLGARGASRLRRIEDAIQGWPHEASMRALVTAMQTGRPAAIRRAMAAAERKLGLRRIGDEAGSTATFDRAVHRPIEGERIADGAPVIVVRPGYEIEIGGERVVLMRPVVEGADPVPPPAKAAPKKPPTKAAPSQPTLAPRSEGRNLTDQLDDIADQSRGEQFNSILRRQGFDRPATVTDARGVDAIVDQGGIELFRGSSAERARALAEGELAAAGDAMGAGAFGRGIYAGGREVAERYAAPDGLTRMALRPDARVITMEDLKALREQMSPSWTDQQAAMFYDPGQFAAALGYDAIAYGAKGAPLTERNFVILNRSALVIERGPVRPTAELRKMTPKQLREYAEQRGIALPDGARKAEILEAVTRPRRAAKTMAPTKAVPPAKKAAKKAAPTPAELAEQVRLAMTKEEARAALAQARTVADLREAARLRHVPLPPRVTREQAIEMLIEHDVGARLRTAAIAKLPMRPGRIEEPLPLPEPRAAKRAAKAAPAKKAPAKKAAPRQPRPRIEPSREAIELERWLSDVVGSRDEARRVASRLSAAQLQEVAAAGRIPLRARATRAEMIDEIVRWTAGKRLQAEGIAGRHLYRPGGATRAASAPTELPAWARDPRAKSSVAAAPTPSAVPKMGPRASRLPRIAEPQDMRGTALAANPKYGGGGTYEGPVTPAMLADGGVSYAQNCSRVVVAYEMRRRGLDVTAGPGTPMGDTPAVYLRTFRQGGKYATRVVRDLSRNMSARDIAREVESWPLGARGIVTVKGHTLNVERDPVTGRAVFIDAQAAKSKSPVMDLQAFIRRMKARGAPTDRWMAVARVDDLDLSDWGLRYVEAPDLDPAA
ncbi:MAG: hypothetical protein IRZ07_28080, partial [Microbispora sp.]|nr:hypothetical protein [Microbispora sp.]